MKKLKLIIFIVFFFYLWISQTLAWFITYQNNSNNDYLYLIDTTIWWNWSAVTSVRALDSVIDNNWQYIYYMNYADWNKIYKKNADDNSNWSAITTIAPSNSNWLRISPDWNYLLYCSSVSPYYIMKITLSSPDNWVSINSKGCGGWLDISPDWNYVLYSDRTTPYYMYKKNFNDTWNWSAITSQAVNSGPFSINSSQTKILYNSGLNIYEKNFNDTWNWSLKVSSNAVEPNYSEDWYIYYRKVSDGYIYKKSASDTSAWTVVNSNSSSNVRYSSLSVIWPPVVTNSWSFELSLWVFTHYDLQTNFTWTVDYIIYKKDSFWNFIENSWYISNTFWPDEVWYTFETDLNTISPYFIDWKYIYTYEAYIETITESWSVLVDTLTWTLNEWEYIINNGVFDLTWTWIDLNWLETQWSWEITFAIYNVDLNTENSFPAYSFTWWIENNYELEFDFQNYTYEVYSILQFDSWLIVYGPTVNVINYQLSWSWSDWGYNISYTWSVVNILSLPCPISDYNDLSFTITVPLFWDINPLNKFTCLIGVALDALSPISSDNYFTDTFNIRDWNNVIDMSQVNGSFDTQLTIWTKLLKFWDLILLFFLWLFWIKYFFNHNDNSYLEKNNWDWKKLK